MSYDKLRMSSMKLAELKFKFLLREPSSKFSGSRQKALEGELSLLSLKRLMKKYYKELADKRDGFVGGRVFYLKARDEVRYVFETDNFEFKVYIQNPFGQGKNTDVFLKILEGAGIYRTGVADSSDVGYYVKETLNKTAELKFEVEMVEDFFDVKAKPYTKVLSAKEILKDVEKIIGFFHSVSSTHPVIEKKVWYDKVSRVTYIEGRIRLTRTIIDINNVLFDTKDYYIKQPKSMPDSAFESIMRSLESQIMNKMKRTSELQFDIVNKSGTGVSYHKYTRARLGRFIDYYKDKYGVDLKGKVSFDGEKLLVKMTHPSIPSYSFEIFIKKPSGMSDGVFHSILKGTIPEFTLSKTAELKFKTVVQNRIGDKAYWEHDVYSLKEIKEEIENFPRKDGWVGEKVLINKSKNRIEITYRDERSVTSYFVDIYVYKPDNMEWGLFLSLLENAKVILKKPSKTAELKFKLEHNIVNFYQPTPTSHQQWINSERNFHMMSLKELVNKVSEFKKEMRLTHNSYNVSKNHYHILLWKGRDSRTPHQHEIFIYMPEGMTPQVFKTLVADRLDRVLK